MRYKLNEEVFNVDFVADVLALKTACDLVSVFRSQGLGFRVWGLGFKVQGLGFKVKGLGSRTHGLGFKV